MNGKNIISSIELIANEKGVNRELIFKALEKALSVSIQKEIGKGEIEVNIDRHNGGFEVYKRQMVVSDIDFTDASQVKLSETSNLKIGDVLKTHIEIKEFSRIGAQVFKQVIKQNFKKAEMQTISEDYKGFVGELYNVTVKKILKDSAIVALNDGVEGFINLIDTNRTFLKVGDKVRVVLESVGKEDQSFLRFSRDSELYLRAILKREVPAIFDEEVSVVKVARFKGKRIKVVVKSNNKNLDAARECVGIKGIRVKEIINAFNGEYVDFINYNENIGDYINNIMYPLSVNKIFIDEQNNRINLAVDEEDFNKHFKHIEVYSHIAGQLLGKEVCVEEEGDFDQKVESEIKKVKDYLISKINVDEDLATILINEGFDSVEAILYSKSDDLLKIEGFDIELVNELKSIALKTISKYEDNPLFDINNIDLMLIDELNGNDIFRVEEVADLSVYELLDILDIDERLAGAIIMEARNI